MDLHFIKRKLYFYSCTFNIHFFSFYKTKVLGIKYNDKDLKIKLLIKKKISKIF